jgi:hypothetical protein
VGVGLLSSVFLVLIFNAYTLEIIYIWLFDVVT